MSVVCCQVEVSASGWLLVHRNPTEGSVSECDRETSIMRRFCPARGCCAIKNSPKLVFLTGFTLKIETSEEKSNVRTPKPYPTPDGT